jgi:ABC-type antimicrobial peptide transport system permease subunit
MMNIDLGYNQENIISVSLMETKMGEKYKTLKTALQAIPLIDKVSGSPLPRLDGVMFIEVGEGDEKVPLSAYYGEADKDFNQILGLEVLQGTDFSSLSETELASAVLINEKTAKTLGWDDPVGKKLTNGLIVTGVVKDFHYSSAQSEINTALIKYGVDEIRNIQFSFRQGDKEAVKAQVKDVFASFGVDRPFEMKDIESYFADDYDQEAKLVNIFNVLTGLLMVIAFLGLFALSTFENQLREKEIGIRKVLGASYLQLLKALNRRFVMLIMIAMIISIPITYFLIDQWLTAFAYRIDNLLPYFTISIMGVVILAIVVLSMHSYFNARKNPVNVLRNE